MIKRQKSVIRWIWRESYTITLYIRQNWPKSEKKNKIQNTHTHVKNSPFAKNKWPPKTVYSRLDTEFFSKLIFFSPFFSSFVQTNYHHRDLPIYIFLFSFLPRTFAFFRSPWKKILHNGVAYRTLPFLFLDFISTQNKRGWCGNLRKKKNFREKKNGKTWWKIQKVKNFFFFAAHDNKMVHFTHQRWSRACKTTYFISK